MRRRGAPRSLRTFVSRSMSFRRPKGARSWDHAQFSKYMEARGYTDPRVMWAEMISRPVEMLAAELNCSLLEAAELQLKASERLAPFVAQELPKSVKVDQRGDFGPRSIRERAEPARLGDGAPNKNGGHGEDYDTENQDLFHFAFWALS